MVGTQKTEDHNDEIKNDPYPIVNTCISDVLEEVCGYQDTIYNSKNQNNPSEDGKKDVFKFCHDTLIHEDHLGVQFSNHNSIRRNLMSGSLIKIYDQQAIGESVERKNERNQLKLIQNSTKTEN